jgi:hypothetical protein
MQSKREIARKQGKGKEDPGEKYKGRLKHVWSGSLKESRRKIRCQFIWELIINITIDIYLKYA